MLIDSSGNVGIGTSSPDYKFTIQGNSDEQVYVQQGNIDNGWLIGCSQIDGYLRFKGRGEGLTWAVKNHPI